ncbi:MAG: FAD-binding oxidoreductase [Acidobacteria bacterium]|nr:FAD-binding oxidoreductase [Acidobacteriota bacterium]
MRGETTEVVIIGGGIVGSSIAYHLTEGGCTDVLIIEREAQLGLGSTGKSAGGVRAQFATAINIAMSRYSIDIFSRFEEITGHPSGYRPHGYLFLATNEHQLAGLKKNREFQIEHGLDDVELLTTAEVAAMVPQLHLADVMGASYCPTDGFVDPYSVMSCFSARARERGARLWLGTEVTAIQVREGQITSVETTKGRVSTQIVVNAAGPWAAGIARMAGVDIPVMPLRRQIVNTQPFDGLPSRLPMVIDMSNGFHFRREGAGILMAWPDPVETAGFKTSFDQEFIEKILTRAHHRAPCLAHAEVNPRRCWAGLYEVTPDHHAILGKVPGIEGLYLANGFSGHGVMHSPATGRILAELILGASRPWIDATQLGLERFSRGELIHETVVL